MADAPPPSYEGAVGKPDSENEDSRIESGVLILYLEGLADEALENAYGPMFNFVHMSCAAAGSSEERERLVEISDQLKGQCEIYVEILAITHLVRLGYRVIDKTRVRRFPYSAYSRISFVREPTWKP